MLFGFSELSSCSVLACMVLFSEKILSIKQRAKFIELAILESANLSLKYERTCPQKVTLMRKSFTFGRTRT